MKALFAVLAKLLGLLLLCWAICMIPQIAIGAGNFAYPPTTERQTITMLFYLALVVVPFAATLFLGWLATFRTNLLARLLKVDEQASPITLPEPRVLLRIGVILIGLYVLVTALPQLVRALWRVAYFVAGQSSPRSLANIAAATVQITLSLFLVLRPT